MEKRVLTSTRGLKMECWRGIFFSLVFSLAASGLAASGHAPSSLKTSSHAAPIQALEQDSLAQVSSENSAQAPSPSPNISQTFPSSGYVPRPEKPLPQYSTQTPLPVVAWDGVNERLFTLAFEPHDTEQDLWSSRVGWLIEYNRSGIQKNIQRLEFDSFEPQRMDVQAATGGLVFWDEGMGSVHIISGLAGEGETPPVLRQDIQEGLSRVDRSFPHRNMYDHAALLTPYHLITFGGYGNWFYKQLLVYLDETTLEWLLVPQVGESLPPRGARAQLFQYPSIGYDASSEEPISAGEIPLWLLHPQIDKDGRVAPKSAFQQFVNRQWLEPVDITLPSPKSPVAECVESFKASVVHKQPGTYRLDPSRSVFAIYDLCGDLVFLNPESMTAYPFQQSQESYKDDYHYSQAFYDPLIDDWIIFHFHMEPVNLPSDGDEQKPFWTPVPVSSQQFTADEIATLTVSGQTILSDSSPVGIILATICSSLLLFGLVLWIRKRQQKPFTFKKEHGHIKIFKGRQSVNEVHRQDLVALFTVVLEKHPFEREQFSWTLQDFDEVLGYHQVSQSIRNAKRLEIMDHFNHLMKRLQGNQRDALELAQDPRDKRKKIIILRTKSFPQLITQGFTQSVK